MKEIKVFIAFLLAILILLVALMGWLASTSTTVTEDRNAMIEMWREVSWYAVPSQTVEHGEDGIIQWQDVGMEAHIRFLLRKPEGDILKSEVWDIQVLDIQSNYHIAHDTMLTGLPEGWSTFTDSGVTGTTRFWKYYEGTTFPPLQSLDDLVHFDSLQILNVNLKPEDPALTELGGLTHCPGLKVLKLSNCTPASLIPLAELRELTHLALEGCGELDLQPLEGLPRLQCVSLRGNSIPTLEILTTLPQLTYLDFGGCEAFPSLEPLTRSTLAYLDLSALPDAPQIPDLKAIPRLSGLVGLSLSGLSGADESLCREILAQCPHLQYLDIYDTPAAAHAESLEHQHLAAFVYE